MSVSWRENDIGELVAYAESPRGEVQATWAPQPGSQTAFLSCPVFECLYEGTRGPGKTDALLMDFCQHVGPDRRTKAQRIRGVRQTSGWGAEWRGILFRQTYPQLTDVINKSKKWFPRLFPGCQYNEQKATWTFPDGESLRFAHIQRREDYNNFHGHAYPWMGFEELTTWYDDSCYKVMFSCCRSPVRGIPRKVRATTNPYGPGHNWVKARFDLPINHGKIVGPIIKTPGSPDRVAIHGYLDENKILLTADPEYKDRIVAAARNEAELRAWVHGDWNITAGGMFDDVWDPSVHVLPEFEVPSSWRINRSFDWGSSKPFSVGWWAISDGTDLVFPDGRVLATVRGDLFRIKEWYGWTGTPNEGLRSLAVEIAQGIVERELRWKLHGRISPGPADTSIFNVENGVSIAADMRRPVRVNGTQYPGIIWAEADKRPGSRKTGWEMMRKMLKQSFGAPREYPGLFVVDSCKQFIRTVPVIPRDEKDLDDVDTDVEDHIADETRYQVRFTGQRFESGTLVGSF